MSSFFSIGEDELDFDDEDCLLAASGIGNLNNLHASTTNTEVSITKKSCMRSKEILDKPSNHSIRRPFDIISNINKSDRACDRKRSSTGQPHGNSSVTLPRNNTATPSRGLSKPIAKRFAIENNSNSLPKSTTSEDGVNLLQSLSLPTFKNAGQASLLRNSGNPQSLAVCNVTIPKQGVCSPTVQSISPSTPNNCLQRSESYGLCELSSMNSRHHKGADVMKSSTVLQQKESLKSPSYGAIDRLKGNDTRATGSANSFSCNTLQTPFTNSETNSTNGIKAFETPPHARLKKTNGAAPSTSREHQVVTPGRNVSLIMTPNSSKTPKTRRFPGPAGMLPKLSPDQNLDDPSFQSLLPSPKKASPVEKKQVSNLSSSEDEEFSREPWNCMHEECSKKVPNAMRYTIVRVFNEAFQQQLERGKVPCLCAIVKAFSLTEADASVLLKDPTGEIHGTLHRKVLENYQTELAPGAGLILKHVSVFSPAPRRYYLNITPGNILQIYPPDPQNIASSQALASQCTQAEGNKRGPRVLEIEPFSRLTDCSKQQQMNSSQEANEEQSLLQKECFEDLLDDLDDEDFLDEALLV